MSAVDAAVTPVLAAATGRVYVAFSGGLDSTVLLHAASTQDRPITALHVNHGLHGDADDWQAHCARTASALAVEYLPRRVQVVAAGSVEAAARDVRYRVFAALLQPGDLLLTAHHRDDQAETGLLRLLQGRGLYGMPACRALGLGRLQRPLLDVPRAELLRYARAHRLRWLEDPANADLRMDRNFLRHVVLPQLRERFAGMDEALVNAMTARRQVEQALAAELDSGDWSDAFEAARLAPQPEAAVRQVRIWLAARGVPVPTHAALLEFVQQIRSAAPDRQPALRVGSHELRRRELRRYRGRVHLISPPAAGQLPSASTIRLPGRLTLPHGELRIDEAADGFRPRGEVTVRFRGGGEALTSGGCRRRVKALLQGAGVPPWERETFPLLYDAAGLLAVPGLAVRDDARVAGAGFQARWVPRGAGSGPG